MMNLKQHEQRKNSIMNADKKDWTFHHLKTHVLNMVSRKVTARLIIEFENGEIVNVQQYERLQPDVGMKEQNIQIENNS